MEKFDLLRRIEVPPKTINDQDSIRSDKNIEKTTPTPILILYLDLSRVNSEDVEDYGKYTAELFAKMLSGTGWLEIVIPIFSGQDSRIEAATVTDMPQNFEEFKEELLKRIKEIHGSS